MALPSASAIADAGQFEPKGVCGRFGTRAPTIGACGAFAKARLGDVEAAMLTCGALGVSRATLHGFPERIVEPAAASRLESWVERRVRGEPVAYILGRRGFWSLDLEITPDVLIPRPDTETLVAAVLPHIDNGCRVLDIGTGCGAVALAIAVEKPSAQVTATDIDPRCIALCRRNAQRLGIDLRLRVADCFDGLDERFNVIVSNPPYVAAGDPHLQRGDLRFEPRLALVGGPDGLAFLARLIAEAPRHLHVGGWLAVEHGATQGAAVRRLFRQHGFDRTSTHQDIEHRPRATVGRLGAAPHLPDRSTRP